MEGRMANQDATTPLRLKLDEEGRTGARIKVVGGGISQIREISGGGSYLSQSDLRANFGMGKAAHADTVEVRWPSGERQVFHDIATDKFYVLNEGSRNLVPQPFARGKNKTAAPQN